MHYLDDQHRCFTPSHQVFKGFETGKIVRIELSGDASEIEDGIEVNFELNFAQLVMRVLVQHKWLILNQVISLLVIRNVVLHTHKTNHIPSEL